MSRKVDQTHSEPPMPIPAHDSSEAALSVQQQQDDQGRPAVIEISAPLVPAYEPDDGPLTDAQIEQIRKMVPQGNFRPTRSLFPDLESEPWPPDADER